MDLFNNEEYIEDDNFTDKSDCQCKHLKLLQAVTYNYIKKFTKNEHLRLIFTAYAMSVQYRHLTCDELLNIFIYKHKLEKI